MRRSEHVEQLIGERQDLRERQRSAFAVRARIQRFADEQLHDEECRTIGCDVVVEHGDCARMIDGVGCVAFAQEPCLDGVVDAELGWSILTATRFLLRCVAA